MTHDEHIRLLHQSTSIHSHWIYMSFNDLDKVRKLDTNSLQAAEELKAFLIVPAGWSQARINRFTDVCSTKWLSC